MNTAKKFAVAICDDSLQDADILENCIRNILADSRITKYTRGNQLLEDLEKQDHLYDLVFLAICMKEKMESIQQKNCGRLMKCFLSCLCLKAINFTEKLLMYLRFNIC